MRLSLQRLLSAIEDEIAGADSARASGTPKIAWAGTLFGNSSGHAAQHVRESLVPTAKLLAVTLHSSEGLAVADLVGKVQLNHRSNAIIAAQAVSLDGFGRAQRAGAVERLLEDMAIEAEPFISL